MRRLLIILFTLGIATLAGVAIHHDPGYAFFSYGTWTLEMPLWVACLLIILTLFLALGLLWVFTFLLGSPHRAYGWWGKRKTKKARLLTYRGLLELAHGSWQRAERFLTKGATQSDIPVINYLSAAKAANEAGFPERCDHYLKLALALDPKSKATIKLTQVELQIQRGELKLALNNLKELYTEYPKHPKILSMLAHLYETTEDYPALFHLLPTLRKNRIYPEQTFKLLEQKVYKEMLPIEAQRGLKELIHFWKHSPNTVQKNPELVYDYAKLLLTLSDAIESEHILRTTLKINWHENLIHLYGLTLSPKPKKQLNFMASHFSEQANNPITLLTLGRLCIHNQLYGKARDYLEQSLVIKPLAETYAELGQLMDHLGQKELRDEYYKKGLFSTLPHIQI